MSKKTISNGGGENDPEKPFVPVRKTKGYSIEHGGNGGENGCKTVQPDRALEFKKSTRHLYEAEKRRTESPSPEGKKMEGRQRQAHSRIRECLPALTCA